MPFNRRSPRRGSRYAGSNALMNVRGGIGLSGDNYKSNQTAIRRHEFTNKMPSVASIALGDYGTLVLCRNKRSFGAGADDPPTATASNNYQSPSVFNGSAIRGFQASIKLSNQGSGNTKYLDVYSITCSFADGLYNDAIYNSDSLVEFDNGADVSSQGECTLKATHITFTENSYKNFKGTQRIVKHLGTLTMTSEDGGNPTTEFVIRGLPAKCRRSQTGMFYGLIFHYSSTKNTDATAEFETSADIKFNEIPAENRIPYKW